MRGAFLISTATTCIATALLVSNLSSQEPEISRLTPEIPIQRHIAPGDQQRFQIALTTGTSASVAVEQRGIDVVVSVSDAEGKLICDYQDEIRREGAEHVEIVASAAGTYTVAVRPAAGAVNRGDFVIRMAAARETSESDRRLQQ